MTNKNKDKVQKEAFERWFSNSGLGTLIIPTGGGKTKIGVMAAVHHIRYYGGTVLIVVPTTNLRDNEWKNEFYKWGYEEEWEHVIVECVQTVYKNLYDFATATLMIVDEIHTTLSPQYSKIYNLKVPYILGLTATPPESMEYYTSLKEKVPPVFKLSVKEAIKMGLVAPYVLYNLPVSFTRKERAMYNRFNQMFNTAQEQLNAYIKAFPADYKGLTPFDLAQKASNDKNHPYHKVGKQFWQAMSMRKWACYKAEHKLKTCVDIIQAHPDKKWIIFSKTTKFVDDIHELLTELNIPSVRYHSKMNKLDREQALIKAKTPEIRVICSAEALNAGYDLPAIDGGICASATSTMLSFIQQLGRTIRYEEGKRALFINLYVGLTQEQIWVRNKTLGMTPKWINSINDI